MSVLTAPARSPLAPAVRLLHGVHAVRLLRGAPTTSAYLMALLVTTITLVGVGAGSERSLIAGASTNLHNMTAQPLRVIIVSAFWLESPALFWPMALLLIAMMAPLERSLGRLRTLTVFAVGHVGATALTVPAVAAGIGWGWLPSSMSYAADVGPSYGLAALAGVFASRVSAPGWRTAARAALIGVLVLFVVWQRDFTDVGHLVAALFGLALAPLFRARGSRPGG